MEAYMNFSQIAKLQEMKKRNGYVPEEPSQVSHVFRRCKPECTGGAGTVIEINVTSPDGKRYETNLKLNRDDLDFLRALGELSSHSR